MGGRGILALGWFRGVFEAIAATLDHGERKICLGDVDAVMNKRRPIVGRNFIQSLDHICPLVGDDGFLTVRAEEFFAKIIKAAMPVVSFRMMASASSQSSSP